MADWPSLPSDLLRRVSDVLLATNDIECYVDMRLVCHNWRSAIPKPCPLGANEDELRFRPQQWILFDEESKEDDNGRHLFLNVSTGRFVRRRVPLLRGHIIVDTLDGLLVLRGKNFPRATHILNPFTGSVLRFAAPIRRNHKVIATVTGPSPTMIFHYAYSYKVFLGREDDDTAVYFVAGPTSKPCRVHFHHDSYNGNIFHLQTILAHAGHVYMVDDEGHIFRIVHTAGRCYGELVTNRAVDFRYDNGIFLVESSGELLLIRRRPEDVTVYRVDAQRGALEPVQSIGGRALFIGHRRCLSVDAEKFPSVDRNCVYHTVTHVKSGANDMGATYRYDLNDHGRIEDISWDQNAWSRQFVPRPHSIVQVLLNYCKEVFEREDV